MHPTINIVSSFTAESIEELITALLAEAGIKLTPTVCAYGQIFQALLNPASDLYRSSASINVILLRLSDGLPIGELAKAIHHYLKNTAIPLIICLCPETSEYESRGNEFLHSIGENKNLFIIPTSHLRNTYFKDEDMDAYANEIAHIPYTPQGFSAIALALVRCISHIFRKPYKVIVTDCDYTLWDGVCGEVGHAGVVFTDDRVFLQQFLIDQYDNGMLLCICSKNNEADVLAVFEHRQDLLLKKKHFAGFRINWENKTRNIQSLSEELNLGLDSFIFIDDNPMEHEEVKRALPEVLSILLTPNIRKQLPFIWAFDHFCTKKDKGKRTALYKQNIIREGSKHSFDNVTDFIESLQLFIEVQDIDSSNIGRVSELSLRTNQFNFSGLRWHDQDILHLINENISFQVIKVADRFGDYGFVGVIAYSITQQALHVINFFLSCRVLGKELEYTLVSDLAKIAQNKGLKHILFDFTMTDKNIPALNFLASLPGHEANSISIFKVESLINISNPCRNNFQSNTVASVQYSKVPANVTRIEENINLMRIAERYNPYPQTSTTSDEVILSTPEVTLRHIFMELLGMSQVKSSENFFELGGTSLLAIQALSRIYKIFKKAISIKTFYENPTINQLLSFLPIVLPMSSPQRAERFFEFDTHYPLSFSQNGLFFLEMLSPDDCAYNIPLFLHLKGDLHINALQHAFECICQKHAVFRTSFSMDHGCPYQAVSAQAKLSFKIIDVAGLNLEQIEPYVLIERQRAFDLSIAPLVRVVLLKVSATHHILLLTIHHIIFDGWSYQLINQDLKQFYNEYLCGIRDISTYQNNHFAYLDFVLAQRESTQSKEWQNQLDYWQGYLNNLPSLHLRADFPYQSFPTYSRGRFPLEIDTQVIQAIRKMARINKISVFSVLLSTVAIMIAEYSGQNDFALGMITAGRRHVELESIIGYFAQMLPVRFNLLQDQNKIDFIRNTHADILNILSHQDIPYEIMAKTFKNFPKQHGAFINVVFVFQNIVNTSVDLPDVKIEPYQKGFGVSQFDLTIEIEESSSRLEGQIYYNASLWNESTICTLAQNFSEILSHLLNIQIN